jgi:hypothetical protein
VKHKPGQVVLRSTMNEEEFTARLTLAIDLICDVVYPKEGIKHRERSDKGRETQREAARNRR